MGQNRIKRLRVFAGPNGAGKSSVYDYLVREKAFHLYYHINPDAIARELGAGFDFASWPIPYTFESFARFLDASPFQGLVSTPLSGEISAKGSVIRLKDPASPDITYLCAAVGEFLRKKMLGADSSFSVETVFSHPSKVEELLKAKESGFKTYLYVVATENPHINTGRVQSRVKSGGHNVPENKTLERYYRTMQNIAAAGAIADCVYFFDNSFTHQKRAYEYFAEKRGSLLRFSGSSVPRWFAEYMSGEALPAVTGAKEGAFYHCRT